MDNKHFSLGLVGVNEEVSFEMLMKTINHYTQKKQNQGYDITINFPFSETKANNIPGLIALLKLNQFACVFFEKENLRVARTEKILRNGRFVKECTAILFFYDGKQFDHINIWNQSKTLNVLCKKINLDVVNLSPMPTFLLTKKEHSTETTNSSNLINLLQQVDELLFQEETLETIENLAAIAFYSEKWSNNSFLYSQKQKEE